MRVMRLVKTSSLYFPKARALRHTSALLRYNARSLRYRYERAQFTIRTSLMFLKISTCLHKSTMHSERFFISLTKHIFIWW